MQRTGIVMELQAATAVVLTKDGEFCKIPRSPDLVVGAEVTWQTMPTRRPLGIDPHPRSSRSSRARCAWRTATAAGLAACLVAGVAAWELLGNTPQAYAYVAVDISPSVKLTVDRQLQVISWQPTDSDGNTLIKKAHLRKGEPLKTFINNLVTTAVTTHMMPNNDHILVATAPATADPSTDTDTRVQHEAQSAVQTALQTNRSARDLHPQVVTIAMPRAVWRAADRLRVSPAKFATFVVARKKGLLVKLRDLNGATMNQVLNKLSVASSHTVSVDLKPEKQPPLQMSTVMKSADGSTTAAPPPTSNQIGNHAVDNHVGANVKVGSKVGHDTPTQPLSSVNAATNSTQPASKGPKRGATGTVHVDVDVNAVTALYQTGGSVVISAVSESSSEVPSHGRGQTKVGVDGHGQGHRSTEGQGTGTKGPTSSGKHSGKGSDFPPVTTPSIAVGSEQTTPPSPEPSPGKSHSEGKGQVDSGKHDKQNKDAGLVNQIVNVPRTAPSKSVNANGSSNPGGGLNVTVAPTSEYSSGTGLGIDTQQAGQTAGESHGHGHGKGKGNTPDTGSTVNSESGQQNDLTNSPNVGGHDNSSQSGNQSASDGGSSDSVLSQLQLDAQSVVNSAVNGTQALTIGPDNSNSDSGVGNSSGRSGADNTNARQGGRHHSETNDNGANGPGKHSSHKDH